MTTVFYRGERRDVKSFTPEEHQDYLDKKQHTINEAKEAIAGMKARIATRTIARSRAHRAGIFMRIDSDSSLASWLAKS